MARRRRKGRGKGNMPTPLRLTSMMDILTVLLLFLLKSFVVEGEVITPAPGVELPESTSDTTPRASVVVAIFDSTVMLDGQMVADIKANGMPAFKRTKTVAPWDTKKKTAQKKTASKKGE